MVVRRIAATSSYTVEFRRPRPVLVADVQPEGRVPRIARLLALAHKIDAKIRASELDDMAHATKVCGVTRPRITQIVNLLLLAPSIQEAILDLPPVTKGRDPITERSLRGVVTEAVWERQVATWNQLCGEVSRPIRVPARIMLE